jgi:NAD+ synthase (glutamine-hydrolysing)
MPSKFNSNTTQDISRDICNRFGVTFMEVPIQEAVDREIEAVQATLPVNYDFNPKTNRDWRQTLQNNQARIRGMRMWNWSNAQRGFWLQTSNMSEKAVGYTTIGGDMMGCYSLIANMPKTVVIALLTHMKDNLPGYEFLDNLLKTEASAELEDDQADEKDLMPFPVLDACINLFAGMKLMPVEVYTRVCEQFDSKYTKLQLLIWVRRFINLFMHSIYKWVQCPESTHIGSLDLDRERALQLQVVHSMSWLEMEKLDEIEVELKKKT